MDLPASPGPALHSLRRDLLYLLMGAIVGSFMLAAVAVYFMARYEVDEVMDYHLRQLALAQQDSVYGTPETQDAPTLTPRDQAFDMVIQIWDDEGLRLYYSNPHAVLPERAQLGYATTKTREGPWRTYSVMFGKRVVQVAQPMALRTRVAASAALRTLLPLVIVLPVIGFLIWFLIGRGLAPLDRLAQAVRARRPDALTPLPAVSVPEEAQPLVEAINGLLMRLDSAMQTQRAFIADAAHELRTPLAALQLQLRNLERASTESDRTAGLVELKAGLQRTIHLAQQLLTLARNEPAGAPFVPTPVDLATLAAQSVADLQTLAQTKNIDLGVDQWESPTWALAAPVPVQTVLTNLIDNALRYTPKGGKIDVSVWTGPDNTGALRAWLRVSDNGPGIPLEERDRVLDRFYRRPGQQPSGSGLGLAIVHAIAQRHGAILTLDDTPGGGLSLQIGFFPGNPTAPK